jgi:hypothetical protein
MSVFQVNLYTLLQKFNAQTEKEYKTYKENFMKRFEITELPPYLILYIKVCAKRNILVLMKEDWILAWTLPILCRGILII